MFGMEKTGSEPSVRFGRHLKAREKHLEVFRKTHENLMAVDAEMTKEVEFSKSKIEEMTKTIEAEKKAIEFLEAEKAKTSATAAKIKDIIG